MWPTTFKFFDVDHGGTCWYGGVLPGIFGRSTMMVPYYWYIFMRLTMMGQVFRVLPVLFFLMLTMAEHSADNR